MLDKSTKIAIKTRLEKIKTRDERIVVSWSHGQSASGTTSRFVPLLVFNFACLKQLLTEQSYRRKWKMLSCGFRPSSRFFLKESRTAVNKQRRTVLAKTDGRAKWLVVLANDVRLRTCRNFAQEGSGESCDTKVTRVRFRIGWRLRCAKM